MTQKQKYHFVGIGGIGMGTLASLILYRGGIVSGSDLKENAMVQGLRAKGAGIFIGHDGSHVPDPVDFVVFSSAVKPDNPELQEARRRGLKILRRAELLAELMAPHKAVTVAGSHGKTTTTSMVSSVLNAAGLNPTTAVGGIVEGTESNAQLGQGEYFVAETDESDGTFLLFHPFYSIITNVDFEHVDYFHSWENILQAFAAFIQRTSPQGCVIGCAEDSRLKDLLAASGRRFRTYGFRADADVSADSLVLEGYASRFRCVADKEDWGIFELSVPGRHNVLNALACITLAKEMNIGRDVIRKSLKSFRGVARRLQFKGEAGEIKVYDDYGHHPSEIRMTLEAVQSFKGGRLITVFQPHRYTRTHFLMRDFIDSLCLGDYVVITDIYAASEDPIPGVSAERIYEGMKERGFQRVFYVPKENIVEHLLAAVRPGDMVLTLGAGDINKIGEQFLYALTRQANNSSLSS